MNARRGARMRQFAAAVGGGGAPPPFASICETAVRTTNITTTSTVAYVNAVTLAAGLLPAGDYHLEVEAYYSNQLTSESDCQLQLTQNGTEIANNRGHSDGSGIAALDAKNLFGNHRIVSLGNQVYTFALNFRVGAPFTAGAGVAVYWSRINLWSF